MAGLAWRTAGEAGLRRQAIAEAAISVVAVAVVAGLVLSEHAVAAAGRGRGIGVTGRDRVARITTNVQARVIAAARLHDQASAATVAGRAAAAAHVARIAAGLAAAGAARLGTHKTSNTEPAEPNDSLIHASNATGSLALRKASERVLRRIECSLLMLQDSRSSSKARRARAREHTPKRRQICELSRAAFPGDVLRTTPEQCAPNHLERVVNLVHRTSPQRLARPPAVRRPVRERGSGDPLCPLAVTVGRVSKHG